MPTCSADLVKARCRVVTVALAASVAITACANSSSGPGARAGDGVRIMSGQPPIATACRLETVGNAMQRFVRALSDPSANFANLLDKDFQWFSDSRRSSGSETVTGSRAPRIDDLTSDEFHFVAQSAEEMQEYVRVARERGLQPQLIAAEAYPDKTEPVVHFAYRGTRETLEGTDYLVGKGAMNCVEGSAIVWSMTSMPSADHLPEYCGARDDKGQLTVCWRE